MRAIFCTKPQDDMSTTGLADLPVPEPGPGEVRVRVMAASLNPVDWKLCTGVAPWWHEPHVVGLDAAGVVDALGEGVEGWQIGDRVVWHGNLNRQGVFAEFAVTVAHVLVSLPETVSFEAAAAVPCAGLTAYQALVRKIRLEAGQTIVIQGASGGVGGFAVQIAHRIGARVIALVRPEKAARAKALGADVALDYRATDLPAEVRAANGGFGADAMLEVANPQDARKSLSLLRYNGHLACVDPLPDLSRTPPYTYAASIHEIALGGAYGAGDLRTQRDFAVMGAALVEMLAEGRLDPMIEAVITLDEVPDYLARLRRREFDGKVVVRIDA
ncbi:MAG: zinc-binding dehydrogenase [Rhodobacteraceae bacterium]|jgi:NADPH2:quinone reductase|nr:zinc-binding dehydrogenase [Paracoccaceae bacterium]